MPLTAAQRAAQEDLEVTLDRHADQMRMRFKRDALPTEWNGLESFDGIVPHKTRVTIRLDADMVRWFRKLGPGYSRRMNDVLRIYWKALMAGQITAYMGDDPMPRMELAIHGMRDRLRQELTDKD